MHFRPPVDRSGFLVLGIPVHRGQRRHAEALDVLPDEKRLLDLHGHRFAPAHHEAERAGHARAVEQGAHRHGCRFSGRCLKVHVREIREFLRSGRHGRVDGEAARRQAILVEFADGAEVGRAEEGHPVIATPVQRRALGANMPRAAFLKAEPGKARALGQLMRGAVLRHVEIALFIDDLARLIGGGHVHAHRLLEKAPQMKECDRPG